MTIQFTKLVDILSDQNKWQQFERVFQRTVLQDDRFLLLVVFSQL